MSFDKLSSNKTTEEYTRTETALLDKGQENDETDEALFDHLIEEIGDYGYFQKRFNILFNLVFFIFCTMPSLSLYQAMIVPDHHCHVPGRNLTNYTLEEWQRRHLPLERDPKTGREKFSSCKMFNISSVDGFPNKNNTKSDIINCQYGWEYDKRWLEATVPSDRDWVCDQQLNIANTFVANRIGEIIGLFIFGQMADRIGRKPVFFAALFCLVAGRFLGIWTSQMFSLFLAAVFLSNTSAVTVFQSPMVICMETAAKSKRSLIALTQCYAWVIGSCILPLAYWWIGDWQWMLVITTLPAVIPLLCFRLIPESPRWLASRGRVKDAEKVLQHIADLNKTNVPLRTTEVLNVIGGKKDKTYGLLSLFANRRLAVNTLLITFCWTAFSLSSFCLLLNIANMSGNPFMNYFWQALIELPGYFIGKYFGDKIGRRWTHAFSYMSSIVFIAAVVISHGGASWISTLFVTCVKFTFTINFYMVWLQAMEVFPTCLRQTGLSTAALVANVIAITGPYIVYMGTAIDGRLPYVVLFGLAFMGMASSSLLPETLNKKLPETIEEAQNFGQGQKFWSFNITSSDDE